MPQLAAALRRAEALHRRAAKLHEESANLHERHTAEMTEKCLDDSVSRALAIADRERELAHRERSLADDSRLRAALHPRANGLAAFVASSVDVARDGRVPGNPPLADDVAWIEIDAGMFVRDD